MNITLPRFTSKIMTVSTLIFMSVLVAAAVPLATTNAQAAAETIQFKELKENALKEIERRLEKFKKTDKNLNIDVHISNENSTFKITTSNGNDSSTSKDKGGAERKVILPSKLKDKVKKFMEKIIEQLMGMKEKVLGTTSLSQMTSLADNIDSQYQITQLTDVQASVTKAIESLSGVFDKLKTTAGGLQSQIGKIKECTTNGTDKSACDNLNVNSDEVANSAQSQLDNIMTMMTTIGSVLASSIVLLTTLVSTFSSITGGLGSLDSLGNLGNLGNISNLGGMLGGLGNMSGLMSSFSAMTSQLGIANGMAGNASGLLSNLTSFINLPI